MNGSASDQQDECRLSGDMVSLLSKIEHGSFDKAQEP